MLRMDRLRNNKCSQTGPKRRCSGPEQYQYPFRYYQTISDTASIFNRECVNPWLTLPPHNTLLSQSTHYHTKPL